MTYETTQSKVARKRQERRRRAIEKIANGNPIVCAVCDCPHAEILHIGHPNHDGSYHRKELRKGNHGLKTRDVVLWVLRTDIEEVLKKVQLECPYCNAWHNRFGDYPLEDKRPKWRKNE